MTKADRDDMRWDMAERMIQIALASVDELRDELNGYMALTPSTNRLTMAAGALDDAIDYVNAARARMPEPDLQEPERGGSPAPDIEKESLCDERKTKSPSGTE